MKRTIKLLSLVLALTLLCTAFISCGQTPVDNTPEAKNSETIQIGDQTSNKIIKVVVGGTNEKVYTVDFSKLDLSKSVLSILEHLRDTQGLALEIEGTMLKRVGDLKEEGSTYVFLWTNVEEDYDVSGWAGEDNEKTWNGEKLIISGKGITDMTVENGAIIYIGTIKW